MKCNKSFYKYISSRSKTRENTGLLLNGQVVTKDVEEAEELNAFLPLVFTSKICLAEFQAFETSEKVWSNKDSSL